MDLTPIQFAMQFPAEARKYAIDKDFAAAHPKEAAQLAALVATMTEAPSPPKPEPPSMFAIDEQGRPTVGGAVIASAAADEVAIVAAAAEANLAADKNEADAAFAAIHAPEEKP